jgi:DHA2 family multidrug resistance protein
VQDHQFNVHLWDINQTLAANDPDVQSGFASLMATFGIGDEAMTAAYAALQGQLGVDALVMAFNDVFFALALACVVVVPLAMWLRPLPKSAAMVMH